MCKKELHDLTKCNYANRRDFKVKNINKKKKTIKYRDYRSLWYATIDQHDNVKMIKSWDNQNDKTYVFLVSEIY